MIKNWKNDLNEEYRDKVRIFHNSHETYNIEHQYISFELFYNLSSESFNHDDVAFINTVFQQDSGLLIRLLSTLETSTFVEPSVHDKLCRSRVVI